MVTRVAVMLSVMVMAAVADTEDGNLASLYIQPLSLLRGFFIRHRQVYVQGYLYLRLSILNVCN